MITNPNQFGFKRKHGTDQCIYVLKEIIDLYRKLNGSVFVCFLDASKAFDRVNHKTLFKQLGARGVPGYILRILIYWYKNQDVCIRWGDAYSAKFKVTNGVRQGGGVLSQSTITKLQIAYHNFFLMFLGMSKYESTSYLCTLFDIQCCQSVIRKLVYGFMCRLDSSVKGYTSYQFAVYYIDS